MTWEEPSLFDDPPEAFRADGATYDPDLDGPRLGAQLRRVRAVMADGEWRTLRELSDAAKAPEASVSARLRDLRKPRFGAHTVEQRRQGYPPVGLWEYRLTLNPEPGPDAEPEPSGTPDPAPPLLTEPVQRDPSRFTR